MAEYTLFPSISEEFRSVEDARGESEPDADPIEAALTSGKCAWCGEEYANPGAHAAQKHPDEWEAYKDD